jgi:hypothetical protein
MTEYLDRPPPGWFVLDVMPSHKRQDGDWSALLVDLDPDDPGICPWQRRDCWFRIPGKHRDRDAASDALSQMMATRH